MEFIEEHKLQLVGLQETVKEDFSDRELSELARRREFSPPRWRPGGVLMGVCSDLIELEACSHHDFCIYMVWEIGDLNLDRKWLLCIFSSTYLVGTGFQSY